MAAGLRLDMQGSLHHSPGPLIGLTRRVLGWIEDREEKMEWTEKGEEGQRGGEGKEGEGEGPLFCNTWLCIQHLPMVAILLFTWDVLENPILQFIIPQNKCHLISFKIVKFVIDSRNKTIRPSKLHDTTRLQTLQTSRRLESITECDSFCYK